MFKNKPLLIANFWLRMQSQEQADLFRQSPKRFRPSGPGSNLRDVSTFLWENLSNLILKVGALCKGSSN